MPIPIYLHTKRGWHISEIQGTFIEHSSICAVGQSHEVHESYTAGLSVRLENSVRRFIISVCSYGDTLL